MSNRKATPAIDLDKLKLRQKDIDMMTIIDDYLHKQDHRYSKRLVRDMAVFVNQVGEAKYEQGKNYGASA